MALQHTLQIELLPTRSRYVLALQDVSLYVPSLATGALVLEVTPPRGTVAVRFVDNLTAGFTKLITAGDLGFGSLTTRQVLPDGVYQLAFYQASNTATKLRSVVFVTTSLQAAIDAALCRDYVRQDSVCCGLSLTPAQVLRNSELIQAQLTLQLLAQQASTLQGSALTTGSPELLQLEALYSYAQGLVR